MLLENSRRLTGMFRTFLCALVVLVSARALHAANPKSHVRVHETPPTVTDDFDPTVRPGTCTIQPVSPPPRPPLAVRLTLRQAENYALANQPLLAASQLRAQAEVQRVYEARSALFPQLQANAVGVKAKDDGSRLAAIGGITNPTILSRQSDGGLLSQLITDFG